MVKDTFVNMSVKNLDETVKFFTALGFKFNPQFTNEKATCMILNENTYVMLLVEEFFKTFMKKEVADASKTTEVIMAIGVESKEAVDEIVKKALAAGGKPSNEVTDYGWMYSHSFIDVYNHLWEVLYTDASKAPAKA